MVKAFLIVFVIVFALFFFGRGEYVTDAVQFTKEQAEYAKQHGAKGLFEKHWCGQPGCMEEK